MTLSELIKLDFQNCSCGRVHKSCLDDVIIKRNAIACLPEVLCKYNAKKVFIISDKNTYKAAGEQVCKYLAESKTDFTSYVIPSHAPKPDENSETYRRMLEQMKIRQCQKGQEQSEFRG